jgi:hypothetical protein
MEGDDSMNPEFNDYGNELQAFDGSCTPVGKGYIGYKRRTWSDILWHARGDGWKAFWHVLRGLGCIALTVFCVIAIMILWP